MELETNFRKLLKVLKDAGFEEIQQRGTVRSIYQQAGLI